MVEGRPLRLYFAGRSLFTNTDAPVFQSYLQVWKPPALRWPFWPLGTSLFPLPGPPATLALPPSGPPPSPTARRGRQFEDIAEGLRSTAGRGLYERTSMLSRPGEELWQRHRACGPCDFFAMLNENEARDTADVEVGGEIGCRLGVDLYEADMWLELGSGALEDGSHHAARTAPFRPEIDQQRDVARLDVLRKARLVESERPTLKERIAASTAFAASIELLARHEIGRVASGTNHVHRLRH